MSLESCKILNLPVVHDERGNLTVVESGREIPFEFKRVYYLYDVLVVLSEEDMLTKIYTS